MEGRTDFNRSGNGTLDPPWTLRHMGLVQWVLGSSWCTIMLQEDEISAKWTNLNVFTLNSALCRLIAFISIKQCCIISFLTHYPVHMSRD